MAKNKMSTFEEMIRDGVAPIKQINPSAQMMRRSEVAAVQAGRVSPECPHPLAAAVQYVDDVSDGNSRPVNLWQCTVCKSTLWLVDGHGKAVSDS